jgi:hypothetical protein
VRAASLETGDRSIAFWGVTIFIQFNLLDIGCWRPAMKNVARDAK